MIELSHDSPILLFSVMFDYNLKFISWTFTRPNVLLNFIIAIHTMHYKQMLH